jgi:uncharacterized damage-inducible protein DinB
VPEEALLQLLYGKGAHVHPVRCIEDVNSEMAGRLPENLPFSIWQTLGHVNFWMNYELQRIGGEKPDYPKHAILSWPQTAAPLDDARWQSEVSRFNALLADAEALARGTAQELAREIPALDPKQMPELHSVRTILWQIASHNSYHIGQIVLIRRALGAWPPQRGGDSW